LVVAGAYSGWMIFSSGFSSSIALSQATPGSNLNIVQKVTGQVLPLESMLLTPLNLVTALLLLVALPLLYCAIQPNKNDVQLAILQESSAENAPDSQETNEPRTLARKLEEAWIFNVLFAVAGVAALGFVWRQNGFSLGPQFGYLPVSNRRWHGHFQERTGQSRTDFTLLFGLPKADNPRPVFPNHSRCD
jgi:short-chain fatty acids transporter